jgi:hypothetical protein
MRRLILSVTVVLTLAGLGFAAPGASPGQDRPNDTRTYQSHHRRYHRVVRTPVHRNHYIRGQRRDDGPRDDGRRP